MKVTYIFRHSTDHQHSIERVFKPIIEEVKKECEVELHFLPRTSAGLSAIRQNLRSISDDGESIYHITGDVNYMALALPPERTLLTLHDIESVDEVKGLKGKILRWLWFVLPLRKLKYISCISNHTRKMLEENFHVRGKDLQVIHNPLQKEFGHSPKDKMDDPPGILLIGTKPNKNLERVIEALSSLSCKLIIIGKLKENQLREIKASGLPYENHYNLSEKELLEVFRKCDLLCFLSLYEGFGLPVVEAQSLGRPVVASNITPLVEISGEGAMLVDPYHIPDIRKSVQKVLEDEEIRFELIKKGLQNKDRFLVDKIAKQYVELYQKIIGKKEKDSIDPV